MRIVNYSNFINEAVNHDALAQSVEDCLVELRDVGFEIEVRKYRDNQKGICIFVIVKKSGGEKFEMRDLKESFDVMIDLLDEGFTYGLKTLFRIVFHSTYNTNIEDYDGYYLDHRNTWFHSDIDLFGLEITNIKGKNNIVRSYESSSYTGYSGFKAHLIEEVDNVLVELTDDNFWFSRELDEKDDNYVLQLCIERTIPDDQLPGQIHDWYEDNLHMFFIRDVYEPLSLLVEWMQEKYSADLVDYKKDYSFYRGGIGTGIFKTDADEDYLDSEVSSVRLKFIWKK
jgi:hypothetical protein